MGHAQHISTRRDNAVNHTDVLRFSIFTALYIHLSFRSCTYFNIFLKHLPTDAEQSCSRHFEQEDERVRVLLLVVLLVLLNGGVGGVGGGVGVVVDQGQLERVLVRGRPHVPQNKVVVDSLQLFYVVFLWRYKKRSKRAGCDQAVGETDINRKGHTAKGIKEAMRISLHPEVRYFHFS